MAGEFGKERREREGIVPRLHDRAQLFLRSLPRPLPRLGPFARTAAASFLLSLRLPLAFAPFGYVIAGFEGIVYFGARYRHKAKYRKLKDGGSGR